MNRRPEEMKGKGWLEVLVVELIGKAGIYEIENIITGERYIGSSMNLSDRMDNYRRSVYSNKGLEKAVKKLGWDNFKINILELYEDIDRGKLELQESKYILQRRESSKLYNIFDDVKIQRILQSKASNKNVARFIKVNEEGKYYLPEETRRRLSEIKKKGYSKSKLTWFKAGGENPSSKKVEVTNIETGEKRVVWTKEVTSITGGTYSGVLYAIRKGTNYKGKYKLRRI